MRAVLLTLLHDIGQLAGISVIVGSALALLIGFGVR
jgi:hypothetical protein